MTTQYLLRKVEDCPVCKGRGILENQDWQDINTLICEWQQAHPDATEQEVKTARMQRIRERWGRRIPPPMESPCGQCEGTGKVETWIDLEQAMHELGYWRPTDWDPVTEEFVCHITRIPTPPGLSGVQ